MISFWTQLKTTGHLFKLLEVWKGLAAKLKGLKAVLKTWNITVFDSIFVTLKEGEDAAAKAQEAYENSPSDDLKELANKANATLFLAINKETTYWKQKANLKRMDKGDTSSNLFHAYAKGRRTKMAEIWLWREAYKRKLLVIFKRCSRKKTILFFSLLLILSQR